MLLTKFTIYVILILHNNQNGGECALSKLSLSVKAISGVGDKKAALLEALGILTVEDLLRFFPRAYQNRGHIKTILEAELDGKTSSMLVTVGSAPKSSMLKNRKTILKFQVFDESGKCSVVFFNQNYLKNTFKLGETYRFWGKVVRKRTGTEISSPEFELVSASRTLNDLVPVYHLTHGLSGKTLSSIIAAAFALVGDEIESVIPDYIRKKFGLLSAEAAFRAIHFPRSIEIVSKAKEYFIFEELLLFALGVSLTKKENSKVTAPPLPTKNTHFSDFLSQISYEPTDAQKRVINEIASDLSKPFAMHRLVMGDVGSGKTLCAAAAAYISVANGYQCAFMVPTEILARQHYNELSPIFSALGYDTALLVGSLTAAQKRSTRKKIEDGTAKLIIGTHALFSDGVVFKNAALTICDEQHRFGINQRSRLLSVTGGMHSLVMSATPIPRTLALAMYGDLDISRVDTMPPGRQKVSTYLVDEGYRDRLNSFIDKQVEGGHQVYVVCPSIEKDAENSEDELVDLSGRVLHPLKDAVSYTECLKSALPHISIGYLHGRMSAQDKDKIMSSFVSGELSVLVSTTVIEVGVNVPSATLMIVENAERFGLSQLHQLRGRVGRGSAKSYCVLVSDSDSEASRARLSALCESTDGYYIAEKDLELRGPGDFFAHSSSGAIRQHGEFSFRLANLCSDTKTFEMAFETAKEILFEDPTLSLEANKSLRDALDSFFLLQAGTYS